MHQPHRILARFLPSLLLAVALCSCSLLIPDNPSAPRYNTVIGGSRRPEMNPPASGGDVQSHNMGTSAATAVVKNDDENTPQPMAAAPTEQVVASDVPPPSGMSSGRQAPAENGIAVAGDYPSLQQVPPSTTDPKEAARLNAVRAQLESDRNTAQGDRSRLNNDAVAEPSLIGIQPPAPVSQPQPSMLPPQSMMTPNGSVALPPPPPPLASNTVSTSSGYNPMAYRAMPSMQNASLAPITLHPPSANSTPLPPPQLSYTPSLPLPSGNSQAMAPATNDGFNPMAGTGTYASNGSYLPDSRYSSRYQ